MKLGFQLLYQSLLKALENSETTAEDLENVGYSMNLLNEYVSALEKKVEQMERHMLAYGKTKEEEA